jgi:hypothetical protein
MPHERPRRSTYRVVCQEGKMLLDSASGVTTETRSSDTHGGFSDM